MAELDELLATNYRLGLRRIRDDTADVVSRAYGTVVPDAIGPSFAGEFAPVVAERLEAGQGAAETLTIAYASAVSGSEPERFESLAGRTETGLPIQASMPGILALILAAIRDGRAVPDALSLGHYLSMRFVDNEISRVTDTTLASQAKGKAIGWRGITHGPADACRGNAGVHPFSQPMYRHPGCRCERVLVRAEAA